MQPLNLVILVLSASSAALAEQDACPMATTNYFSELKCANSYTALPQFRPINGWLVEDCPNSAATGAPYGHLGPVYFADGDWEMRRSVNGSELPSPRTIVNEIFRNHTRALSANLTAPNMLVTMMAQVWAHDIGSMSNVENAAAVRAECCVDQQLVATPHKDCAAIKVLPNDPDFGTTLPNLNCLSMVRTLSMDDGGKPTLTKNTVTALLDASILYGSTAADLASIREYTGGRLKVDAANIMPVANGRYYIGDSRVMQTPHLAIHHSIWLREHNRLAGILRGMHAQWDDERLFQEARRILIAEFQNIVYEQFLPTFFHPSVVALLDVPEVTRYMEGTTYAEMGQSIFRSFHGLIPSTVTFLDEQHVETAWPFHSMLIDNQPILQTYYEDIVRGMMRQPCNAANYDQALFSKLFTSSATAPGTDLLSVDITRGRDHGVSPYAEFLRFVKEAPVESFADLETHIDPAVVSVLEEVYASVHDIDLLVGALLETPMEGTLWGPTIQLITLKQFMMTKTTDPYFYTNAAINPRPFTTTQLAELKKFNTNHLFCLNTDIAEAPLYPSFPAQSPAEYVACSQLTPISYAAFVL